MCVYIYHYIFIPSSVDELLSCFYSLAILNNVAMSIEVHLSFQISAFAFFRHRPGVELLGHVVVLFSVFEKLQCCFPQWPHQFTLLPTVYEESLFSTSSPTFWYLCSF